MAITVNDVKFTEILTTKSNDTYTFEVPAVIEVTYTKKDKQYKLILSLNKGFRTDGASVPALFTWFLPKWDKKNMVYNCGAIVHDCLYTTKGISGLFTREECDDFIRGIWRISGISRFRAGVGDVCLFLFGGGDKHWGIDDLDNVKNKLMSFDVIQI